MNFYINSIQIFREVNLMGIFLTTEREPVNLMQGTMRLTRS